MSLPPPRRARNLDTGTLPMLPEPTSAPTEPPPAGDYVPATAAGHSSGLVMTSGGSTGNQLPSYKLLLIGDCGVGKSNLLQRFANNKFDINMRSTIGVEFVSREIDCSGGSGQDNVIVQLWDTAGQERCGLISASFFRNAKGIAVVYDMTRRQSLLNVPRWVAHAKQFAGENCVFQIIGNKSDLDNLVAVSHDDAEEIAHSLGLRHCCASARSGDGVPDAFFQLILGVHTTQQVAAEEAASIQHTPSSNRAAVVPERRIPVDVSSFGNTDNDWKNHTTKKSCC